MERNKKLNNIPDGVFFKETELRNDSLVPQQKVALNRKGNALFNEGKVEQAKRIYLCTGYTQGLIQVGDYYVDQGKPLDALKLYKVAPAPDKVEFWVEKMALVIRDMIEE